MDSDVSVGKVWNSFKEWFGGTYLGAIFFNNMTFIVILVLIILFFLFLSSMVDVKDPELEAEEHKYDDEPGIADPAFTAPLVPIKRMYIEPLESLAGLFDFKSNGEPVPASASAIAKAKAKATVTSTAEGFHPTRDELSEYHKDCKTDFCILNNSTPEELQRKCAALDNKDKCNASCCCGWVKYGGNEKSECVAGDHQNPINYRTIDGAERDVDYYYFMTKCVRGSKCPLVDRLG